MSDLNASFVRATDAVSGGAAPTPRQIADRAAAQDVAQDYESFFLSQVLESMFAGIKTDGIFGGGNGENVFRSLLLQEYGKAIAKQGGIGLSDALTRDMLKLQEVQ